MNRTGFARHGAASVREAVAVRDAAIAAEHEAAREARALACTIEADRTRLTAANVARATHVRDAHGWHRVVRISAKSVTVETGYSWTDRIPLDRILEIRRP